MSSAHRYPAAPALARFAEIPRSILGNRAGYLLRLCPLWMFITALGAADVDFEVWVTRHWHSEYGTTGGNCWESFDEEYTGKVWGWDNVNTSRVGGDCKTVENNGDASYETDYLLFSRAATAATEIWIRYEAFEDDEGDRCSRSGGDDCQLDMEIGPLFFRNQGLNVWTGYGPYGSDDHTVSLNIRWNYVSPAGAPTALPATGVGTASFTANWSAPAHASEYRLDLSTDASFATYVSGYQNRSVPATSLVIPASPGTTYYYRVRAVNGDRTSAGSNTVTVVTVPAAPGGFTASDGTVNNAVRLTWSAVAGANGGYFLYRHTVDSAATATLLNPSGTSLTTYDDTSVGGAPPLYGQVYYYWVRARNTISGESALSASESGFHGLGPPLNVSATDGSDPAQVVVTWSTVPVAEGYDVYRHTDNESAGATVIGATAGSAATTYHDTSALDGPVYWYWVKSTRSGQASAFSAGDSGQRSVPIPASLSATDGVYKNSIRIAWNSVPIATGYDLYRNTSATPPGSVWVANHPGTSYDDTSALTGQTYYYWVRAKAGARDSALSTYDQGSRGVGETVSLTVNSSGSIKDGSSQESTPYFGVIDATWPYSNESWRAFFWWGNTGLPAGLVIEKATLGHLGYVKRDYEDDEWFDPRAARLPTTRANWNSASASQRHELLNIDGVTPRLFGPATDQGSSYNLNNIPLPPSAFAAVATADFGVGFNYTDKSGGGYDDSTKSEATAGPLTVTYYLNPGLYSPASGSIIESGTPTDLRWNQAMTVYDPLRFRVQVSNQSNFGTLLIETLVSGTYVSITPVDYGTYYWRMRIEDPNYPANASAWSSVWNFTVPTPPLPEAPINLNARDGTSFDFVRITWDEVAVASSYKVYRHTSNNPAGLSPLATVTDTLYDDTSATPGQTYYYWAQGHNSTGDGPLSAADTGYRSSGGSTSAPADSDGSIWHDHDGDWGSNATPYFGWVDNTWPVDDDHYIAYFWWNSAAVPATSAIEQGTIAHLGFNKDGYADSDWSYPRATRIQASQSAFNGAGSEAAKWTILAPSYSSTPLYLNVTSDPGASYQSPSIALTRAHLPLLNNGQRFGMAFDSTDTSGDTSDDSTRMLAGVGPLAIVHFGAPSPVLPAHDSSFPSGTNVVFQWNGSTLYSPYLRTRLQVARSAGFETPVYDALTTESTATVDLIDGGGYYWRIRLEDRLESLNYSTWSATRTFTIAAPSSLPEAVTGLSASDGDYSDRVQISWMPSVGASSYEIWRATNNQLSAALLQATVSTTTWDDTTATPAAVYYYWVMGRNSLGAGPAAGPDNGFRAIDRGLTTVCPIASSGAIENDTVYGFSSLGEPRFGLDDGSFWNTWWRGFLWWNTAGVPDGSAIDSAVIEYLGSDPVDFTATSEKTPRAARLALAYAAFQAASLEDRYQALDVLDPEEPYLREPTTTGASLRVYDVAVPRGHLSALRHEDRYGMAFNSDEDDYGTVEDTSIFNGVAGRLFVVSYPTPGLLDPAPAATIEAGLPVGLSWESILPAGQETYLRYVVQVALDPAFEELVHHRMLRENQSSLGVPVDNRTYYWRVRLEDSVSAGNVSAWSPIRHFEIPLPLPAEPRNFTASDGASPTEIRLSWSPVIKANDYALYRSDNDQWSSAVSIGTATAASHADTGLQPNRLYYYWVRARNTSGSGPAAGPESGCLGLPAPAQPNASDGLGSAITLHWSAVPNADWYEIWRSTLPGVDGLVAPAGTATGLTWTDQGALGGIVYYYWIRARNTVATSPFSPYDSGYHGLPPPATVEATDGTLTDRIAVSWSEVSGALSYTVWRATLADSGQAAIQASVTGDSWDDLEAARGQSYHYWITSHDGAATSGLSRPDSGWIGLPAPSGLTASDGTLPDRIQLAWSVVPTASGYRIWRTTTAVAPAADQTAIGETGEPGWADLTALPNTVYHYWLRAFHAAGSSALSPAETGFRGPTDLQAGDGAHPDRVQLNWTACPEAAAYTIWRATADHFPSAGQIGAVGMATTYDDTTAATGTIYHYWVKAARADGSAIGVSESDPGNRGGAQTVMLPLLSGGSIRNTEAGESIPYQGYVDNSWPFSNDHYRAYFWWDTSGLPAGRAIEQATLASLGYAKVNFQDTDWPNPKAVRIPFAHSTFSSAPVGSRWTMLEIPEGAKTYANFNSDRGPSVSFNSIALRREDLVYLRNGQHFGIGFDSTDTTGGSGDDSTLLQTSAGTMTVTCFSAPSPASPTSGATFPSGATVQLQWAPAFPLNPHLQYRLQAATSPDFLSPLVNVAQIGNQYPFGPLVACAQPYFWRVRIEDKTLADASLTEVNSPDANASSWSAVLTFTIENPDAPPVTPTGLQASQGTLSDLVRLLWDPTPLADEYAVYRALANDAGQATLIGTISTEASRYYDGTASTGVTYYYWVRARNCRGQSDWSAPASGFYTGQPTAAYFPQSIASGSPRPDSVILWTRVWDASRPEQDYNLALQVATDAAFTNRIVDRLDLKARLAHDGCVKVKIDSLQPGTFYHYRFRYLRDGDPAAYWSRPGRTKTAPEPDRDIPIRFAYMSCQDYIGKYYNPLADLAYRYSDTLDFFVYIGDYIYETTGNPEFQAGSQERSLMFTDTAGAIDEGTHYAAKSLSNYRELYKTYRSDTALQRIHELFPMIATWDDHEFSDDNHGATASYRDEKQDEYDPVRKRNSEQAFVEYMPVEFGYDDYGVAVDESILYPNWHKLYDTWRFGKNVELLVTDYRSYRPDHVISESAFPGEIIMTEAEVKTALRGVHGWSEAELAAQWPSIQEKFDPYDPGFSADGAFGLAVQAAVTVLYQNEGLSFSEATGRSKQAVKDGRMSATLVNAAAEIAGLAIGYSDSEMAGFPRGLSYAYLAKVLLFGPIGARYAVLYDNFNLYAWHRYQASLGASENVFGDAQRQWLQDSLSGSDARWKMVFDSVSFTPMIIDIALARSMIDIVIPPEVPASLYPLLDNRVMLNADAWDGFPYAKREMLDLFGRHNAVILSGDIHSTWVTRHIAPNGRLVPEFTGTSVSSGTVEGLFTGVASGYPMVADLIDLEATLPLLKPLFLQSARYANTDSTILDAALGANGYLVVDAGQERMEVLRHELPCTEVTNNYYDEALKEILRAKFTTTRHVVTRLTDPATGATTGLSMDLPAEIPNDNYNHWPVIAEGSEIQVNLSQNNHPTPFQLTLQASDEDGHLLQWEILQSASHGAASIPGSPFGATHPVSYQPNPNFQGQDQFVVRVRDPLNGYDTIIVNVLIEQSPLLDLWVWNYFPTVDPAAHPDTFEHDGDPDRDGRVNLLEYALGTNPNSGRDGQSNLVHGFSLTAQDRYLTLRFVRRTALSDPDLTYEVQMTSDLAGANWLAAGAEIEETAPREPLPGGLEWVTLRVTQPLLPNQPKFLRLRVTLP